jgi:hypothetical protein
MKTWKPTKRQEDFLSIPDDITEALYGGAAGGGKSEVLLNLPLVRQFHQEPKFKGIIFRRTLPELDRELIPRSQADGLYAACGAIYKDQKKRWDFPSGAILQFGHLEHEKDVKIYDSAEYNYMAWDEATSFTPYQYEYLSFSRCRSSSSNLPAIVRVGTNPGGVSHNYFRARFVEPCRTGNKLIIRNETINGRTITRRLIFIPSKLQDNPYLMQNDPNYINTIQLLPPAERAAKADGDWWIYAGQAFEDFREFHLPTEPDNAIHVIEPFSIPYFWTRILSIDWGGGGKTSAMTHALWSTINPFPCEKYPAKIYCYREYVGKHEKISTWAANLSMLSRGEELKDIVLDPSAFGDRGDDYTIAQQFARDFKKEARRADNDRLGGAALISEFLRWKTRPPRYIPAEGYNSETALRIRRIQGEEALREYEKLFIEDSTEEYLPKLQIFNTCTELIKTIPSCNKNPDKPGDVLEFSGDDPYDDFRYNLKACQYYLETGQREAKAEAERAKVLQQFETTGNQTNFYMQMDRLESKQSKMNKPISRRRHGTFRRIIA